MARSTLGLKSGLFTGKGAILIPINLGTHEDVRGNLEGYRQDPKSMTCAVSKLIIRAVTGFFVPILRF
jgi:hypothetical protein